MNDGITVWVVLWENPYFGIEQNYIVACKCKYFITKHTVILSVSYTVILSFVSFFSTFFFAWIPYA